MVVEFGPLRSGREIRKRSGFELQIEAVDGSRRSETARQSFGFNGKHGGYSSLRRRNKMI